MTVDKVKLKALAERLMVEHDGGTSDPIPAIPVTAPDVLALLAEIDQLKASLQPRTDHPANEDCEHCGGCGHDYYGEPCVGCCKPASTPAPASLVLPDPGELGLLVARSAGQADRLHGCNHYTACEMTANNLMERIKELNP